MSVIKQGNTGSPALLAGVMVHQEACIVRKKRRRCAATAAFPALSLTLIVSCVFRITGGGGRRIRSSAGSEDGLAAHMYDIRELRVVLMLFALVPKNSLHPSISWVFYLNSLWT